jgi:hypothetical protein
MKNKVNGTDLVIFLFNARDRRDKTEFADLLILTIFGGLCVKLGVLCVKKSNRMVTYSPRQKNCQDAMGVNILAAGKID